MYKSVSVIVFASLNVKEESAEELKKYFKEILPEYVLLKDVRGSDDMKVKSSLQIQKLTVLLKNKL